MSKFDEILNSSDASDALLGEQIDKLEIEVANSVKVGDTYFPTTDVITIPNDSDLNNYTEIGNYAVFTGGASNTIVNNPATGGGFRLIVTPLIHNTPGNTIFYQWIIPNNHDDVLYYRRKFGKSGSDFTFFSWYKFGGTAV